MSYVKQDQNIPTKKIKDTFKTQNIMAKGLVRIRLARFGRKHTPKYNIVVTHNTKARDAKPIEVLGTYDPIPKPRTMKEIKNNVTPVKEIHLDMDKSKYWVSVGAQPSDTVLKLFMKCGILTPDFAKNKKFYPANKDVESPLKIMDQVESL